MQLMEECKLCVDGEHSVQALCEYNADLCRSLGLRRLAKTLTSLSTLLEPLSEGNVWVPDRYSSNYIAKWVQRMVDELYWNDEIQGCAIVACLIRQSQLFVLLLVDGESEKAQFGGLLQSAVMQYVQVLQYRMERGMVARVNYMEELEEFSEMLEKQKMMVRSQEHEEYVIV